MDTQTDIPWENICLDESFFQPLPQLHTAAEWVKKSDLSYSSPAVSATVPPAYWLEVDATHYLLKADKALEKPKVKRYLQVRANPSTDPLFRMRVEADVVRFGNEQLVFHVNHALFANFGATIESFSEYHTDGCRPDKVWRQYDPKGNAHEAVALLESKIKCGIEENEFLAAKLYPGEDPKKKLAAVVRKTKKTHFMKKSLKIMSQVSKYARSQVFNTNYVALFDSNYLFLCVFDQQNPVALKGTLIPCQGPKSNIARRAFLGWLIEAWEKKCEGENFRAPPHPDDGKTKKKDKKDNADEAP
ncbi:hypothetical protein B0I37DRAFT_374891 [Chaetomium sp. MPI-CAGE-AT-0009]|nr:hypothetical protein B0I37DRAFT_374891 [Chaetomium sp. MPI-CAGE-AT-0009]